MTKFWLATLPIVIALFATSVFSRAQNNPCARLNSTTDQSQCASRELELAEQDLKLAFDAALSNYTESEAKKGEKQPLPKSELSEQVRWEKTTLAKLRESQRRWLAYRESACGTVQAMFDGGTIGAVVIPLCKADLTRERSRFLREYFAKND